MRKHTLLTLAAMFIACLVHAVEPPFCAPNLGAMSPVVAQNTTAALEHYGLPYFFARFDQRVDGSTTRGIVRVIHSDFTKKDPVTKKAPLYTTTYRIDSTRTNVGQYGLGFLFNRINDGSGLRDYEIDGDTLHIVQPLSWNTVNVGPFAGQTYWVGESYWKGIPVANGYDIECTGNPFRNTISSADTQDRTRTGLPEPTLGENPKITVITEEYSTIRPGTVTKRVRNGKTMDKQTLLRELGWTYEQFKWNTRTTHHFRDLAKNTDHTKYIMNHYMGVVRNGDNFRPMVHFNGTPANQINYRGLQTAYGKFHPSYVVRIRLYNGDKYNKDSIYGSSWFKAYQKNLSTPQNIELQDININIRRSNTVAYDAVTNTLTVDTTAAECHLWFTWEELPAQGKNDGGETIFDLKDYARCKSYACQTKY